VEQLTEGGAQGRQGVTWSWGGAADRGRGSGQTGSHLVGGVEQLTEGGARGRQGVTWSGGGAADRGRGLGAGLEPALTTPEKWFIHQ